MAAYLGRMPGRFRHKLLWAFDTSVTDPGFCKKRYVASLFLTLVLVGSNLATAQQKSANAKTRPSSTETSTSEASLHFVNPEISGSRLLAPASFDFTIPTAHVVPTDLKVVETTDMHGETVIAKVHAKVGDNYVVMLPNGRLVDRFAADVAATEKEFKPATHKEIGQEILDHDVANFSNMRYQKSKHYVYVYNANSEFKDATRSILESMITGVETYAKNMGIETHKPEVPLVVIMFSSEREYQAYREMPRGQVAYYDMVSNHIVLHQESPLHDTRPDLAMGQLLSTIAHEGAHQVLHNIGVQQRLSMWPFWLSEGLAEYLAPTSFGRNNRWKGAGVVNDLRMFELETYLQTQFITGFDGSTVSNCVVAQRLDSTGYATAWSIVHYLANQKRKEFNDYVKMMSGLGPLHGMAARSGEPIVDNMIHFKERFGEDIQEMETNTVDYLADLDYRSPVNDFVHYVGMAIVPMDGSSKKFACFFHTREKVLEWRETLESQMNDEQKRETQWDSRQVESRGAATVILKNFMK